jgi:hypothetical protein
VTSPLTILGAEEGTTVIGGQTPAPDPASEFRLVHIAATDTLSLERLILRRGGGLGIDGGGLFNRGTLALAHSTVARNSINSAGGGGILNEGTLFLTNSTLSDNVHRGFRPGDDPGPEGGGGLFNRGLVILINTTVGGNGSSRPGGGLRNAEGGTVILIKTTVAENSVTGLGERSGGIGNANGAVVLQNTIFASNMSANPGTTPGGNDCRGRVTSLGHNLIGDPAGCTITLQATDLTGDPGLDVFTDDGTPGNGHFPLLPTSQAIDAGNDAVCPPTDQLGQPRVGVCDIGAIEFQGKKP